MVTKTNHGALGSARYASIVTFLALASLCNISRNVTFFPWVVPACRPGHQRRTCDKCTSCTHEPSWTLAAMTRLLSRRVFVKLSMPAIFRTSADLTRSLQSIPRHDRSKRMKLDSIFFSRLLVSVQVSAPYAKIGRTIAWNSLIRASRLRSACHRGRSLDIMPHASPFLRWRSSSLLGRTEPR